MATACPACSGTRTLPLADHYAALVRLPEADPGAAAPFAPPLARALWPGTLALTLFFLAALTPGFVAPARALATGLGFACLGVLALVAWRRASRTDRLRQAAYRESCACLDCGRVFGVSPCP